MEIGTKVARTEKGSWGIAEVVSLQPFRVSFYGNPPVSRNPEDYVEFIPWYKRKRGL